LEIPVQTDLALQLTQAFPFDSVPWCCYRFEGWRAYLKLLAAINTHFVFKRTRSI
jgi:hypothetical protein